MKKGFLPACNCITIQELLSLLISNWTLDNPLKPYSLFIDEQNGRLLTSGGICSASAYAFSCDLVREVNRLENFDASVCLEFEELDLLDGIAVAETVNALREILDTGFELKIYHAPQMLAHTLYKTGMLVDGRILLVDPIEEESTAN